MQKKLPSWFKQEIPDPSVFERLQLLADAGVHTVCQEAGCPNLSHCFTNQKLTFLILGDACTRNCRFCAIGKSKSKALGLDNDEPRRIAEACQNLALRYVVITSVTRDDLPDGGAQIFARVTELIHSRLTEVKIELLIPDFQGKLPSLKRVIETNPDVIAHNLETIERLYPQVRPQADYRRSLKLLADIKKLSSGIKTKSSIILGLGETEVEVVKAMEDLIASHCDYLTLGQYLAPSAMHYPVKEFIPLAQFEHYRKIALALGFKSVLAGPLVRSSYQAETLFSNV